MEQNPEEWKPWKGPTIWRIGLELIDFVHAPLHLMFLGIVKKVFERIIAWNRANGSLKEFSQYTQNLMESLKQLGLRWLQCETFQRDQLGNVAVGGWILANYVAFARVLPWFIAGLKDFTQAETYVLPEKPQSKWTMTENRTWLKAHGICKGYGDLRATELQKFTEREMNHPIKPKVVAQKASPFHTMEAMCNSLVSMLAEIMQRDVHPRRLWRIDRKVKIFLSDFDKFSSYLIGIALIDDEEMEEIFDVGYEEDVKDDEEEEREVIDGFNKELVTQSAGGDLVDDKPLDNMDKIETDMDNEERKEAVVERGSYQIQTWEKK